MTRFGIGSKKWGREANRDQMMIKDRGNDRLTFSGRVVKMTMPGFTAEVSLYESRRRYRSHSAPNGAGRMGNHALVAPQACGAFKSLACNGLILGCVGCTAFFPNVPAMVGCFAACLGGFYGYCRDCIDVLDVPENGGGGGGGGAEALPAAPAFPTNAASGVTTANARFAFQGMLPAPDADVGTQSDEGNRWLGTPEWRLLFSALCALPVCSARAATVPSWRQACIASSRRGSD